MQELDICLEYLKEIDQIKKSSLPTEDKVRIINKRIKSIHRNISEIEEEMTGYYKNGIHYQMAANNQDFYKTQIKMILDKLNKPEF